MKKPKHILSQPFNSQSAPENVSCRWRETLEAQNCISFCTQLDGSPKFEEDSTRTLKQIEEGRESLKPCAAAQPPNGVERH